MNNTNKNSNTSEIRAEQVTNNVCEVIYLGTDLHKKSVSVARILEHSTAQPTQRFTTWELYLRFVEKQTTLAKKVYVVYEAGAFGFWLARQLNALPGVECLVCHPQKLDPHHKRVQTDKLDARRLAENLQRYVLGNRHALVKVYIPSPTEEQQRIQARHRRRLNQELQGLRARGRGLLLGQGIFDNATWWKEASWQKLEPGLSQPLLEALSDARQSIELLEKQLRAVNRKLVEQAPKQLPYGAGRLTFMLLLRELCNYQRFNNRRGMGGFLGLCGAVSSSGPYHVDLSINKAGSGYLRALLVELAWRMTRYQPNYKRLKAWRELCQEDKRVHRRRRKILLVALARQIAVDLWRWQTGRVTPEQLGWKMVTFK